MAGNIGKYDNYAYKREPLEDEELDRLVNSCQTHEEKLCILVLADTGLRVSEFTSLKPEMIRWQDENIRLQGKGGKIRVVPLSLRSRKVLEAHFAIYNEIGFSQRSIQRIVKRVAERAGITKKVSPHILRHTFAVRALRKGIDLRALQEALGHAHISTTENYLRYSGKRISDAFKEAGW